MYGQYKDFKTKFQDSYDYYKIDLNNITDPTIRVDIKLIPEAIELGYKVKEGKSFGAENVFEREISKDTFKVVWFVINNGTPLWKQAKRIGSKYKHGKYFNSLSEALISNV